MKLADFVAGRYVRAAAFAVMALVFGGAHAETQQVRIGYQFGFQYIPILIVKHKQLLEKYARQEGLDGIQVSWLQFSGGGNMNDALLSRNLDFGEVGVGPFIQLWAKTRGNYNVKAVAATGITPMVLTSNNPAVKTLKDLGDGDRIALPAVKSSNQAIALQMAVAKLWGDDDYQRLDKLTVSMKHPDGVAAMLTGKAGISAHFTVPPFSTQELAGPGVHEVLDSYEVYGEPGPVNVIYATGKFREDNPRVYRAFLAALTEATRIAQDDRKFAGEVFIAETGSKMDPRLVEQVLKDPKIRYTIVPSATLNLARFMKKVGIIAEAPTSWKDMFFPEVHGEPGS